jgi:hypothetical protein
MSSRSRTVSLVAERAVRYLRERDRPVKSVRLAREVLATSSNDEATARRVLESVFAGDPRLEYGRDGWRCIADPAVPPPDPVRVLLDVDGGRPARGRRFEITQLTAIRLEDDTVVAACGGNPTVGGESAELRRSVVEALSGAVLVIHDPPGALAALERWLDAPLGPVISLRRLGRERCGLPAGHTLEDLASGLEISWLQTDDPLDLADVLDACLEALRDPDETLYDVLRASEGEEAGIDWSRFAFDIEFLRGIPAVPGTYRFYDADGDLLYVGKSNDLRSRVGSYFRTGGRRSERVDGILRDLHRIEIEPSGSDLEAVLREAEQIRRDRPLRNVQRRVHARDGVGKRLRSIMILEPASPPWVLRAFLIRDGRLIDRVGIGPRGGGLKKIERILRDRFFSFGDGPTTPSGPDLDVEMVARWLAAHRDRVVAFDPTDLVTPEEVTDRLRWFLARGSPFEPDGSPILSR